MHAASLRERGYAILPPRPPEVLARLVAAAELLHARYPGPLTEDPPRWLADHVERAKPGLAFYGVLREQPALAPDLFGDDALQVLREVLGPRLHLELAGAVLADQTRPFTEWESHLGGVDDERWRKEGRRPRQERVLRVVHFTLIDGVPEDGAWQVLPRAIGDPVEPAGPITEPTWPGAVRLTCPPGSVLLLEESVWHSVLPRATPGPRRFFGAFFASPDAAPTMGRDTSLDTLPPEARAALAELLRYRPE